MADSEIHLTLSSIMLTIGETYFNPLSANPTKLLNTLKVQSYQ